MLLELVDKVRIDFVAMSVTLVDGLAAAVEGRQLTPLSASLEESWPCAESHSAAHHLFATLGHEDHTLVLLSIGVKLFRGRVLVPAEVSGGLDDGDLETKANAQVALLLLASEFG